MVCHRINDITPASSESEEMAMVLAEIANGGIPIETAKRLVSTGIRGRVRTNADAHQA